MAVARKKKSSKGWMIGLVIGAVVVSLGAAPQLMAAQSGPAYQTATVSKEDIATYFTFTGEVSSKYSQKVMAQKVLQVDDVKVEKGQRVEKDDILFTAKDGTKVRAKIDGVVTKIYVSADEQVMAGAQLADLYDLDQLQVTLRVDEYDLPALAAGDDVDITINALDKTVVGQVKEVADTGVNQNGVAFFTAEVALEKDPEIKIGMTAEATVKNQSAEDALVVPVKALTFDDENNAYLYVKNSDGEMIKLGVTVGISDGTTAEILTGVSQGMTVYYSAASTDGNGDDQERRSFTPPMRGAEGGN